MSMIETRVHGLVHELRLARPPVNALDPALCGELVAAINAAVSNGAQGIVLAGAQKVFSAGLDVPYLLSLGDDHAALTAAWTAFFEAARTLADCPVPVVAAMAGHAPAGGCVLALCCDYRIMAEGPFRIGLNETQVGLVAPEGIQRLLRRLVGVHRAGQLLIGGEMVAAERAHALGMVDELVPLEQVDARALAWMEQLLRLPRSPMLATRAIARADLHEALAPEHIQLERFVQAWYEADAQAALTGLLARLGKG